MELLEKNRIGLYYFAILVGIVKILFNTLGERGRELEKRWRKRERAIFPFALNFYISNLAQFLLCSFV